MIRWWWCCPTTVKLAEDSGGVVERWGSLLRLGQRPSCWPSRRINIVTDLRKAGSRNLTTQELVATDSSPLTAVPPLECFPRRYTLPVHPIPSRPPWGLLHLFLSPGSAGAWSAGPGCLSPGLWARFSPSLLRSMFQRRLFLWPAHRKLLPHQFISWVRAAGGLFPQVVFTAHLSAWS